MSNPLTNAMRTLSNCAKPLHKPMTFAATCLLALCVSGEAYSAQPTITPTSASEASQPSLYDAISSRAKLLAKGNYKPLVTHIPEALAKMDYDQYRSIRFRPDASLWRNESQFEVQLFHAGFLFKEPIALHMGSDAPMQFKQEFFNYDGKAAPLAGIAPKDIGFAGFRLHYPLNNKQYKDEFAVFQGASYFRLVGPGHAYGLSARGLAIDTAEPKGEEFPVFREFWMLKPTPVETHLVIYALMDSPSVTGAYRFDLYPGNPNYVKITARVYARKDVNKVGFAPLTSMFMFGENSVNVSRFDDFRPEVHDSDGLLMHASSGEWIWRPLDNHRSLHVSSLGDTNPKGFGLMQRDRDFNNYLDTEANYERRPSMWITPDNAWGKGRVELVEIPSDSEANDNIVAYWVPDQALKAGETREFKYTLRTLDGQVPEQTVAKVLRSRTGWGAVAAAGENTPKSKRQFAIDFRGGELDKLPANAVVEADLGKNSGAFTDLHVSKLPDGKTYRASFKVQPDGNNVVDMRLFIKSNNKRLSEVWSYVWYPDNIQ